MGKPTKTFFHNAFQSDIKSEWKGIDYIAGNDSEVENLAYYRALACFVKDDLKSIKDRRELLYNYLSREFDAYKETSTINRFYDTLPTKSIALEIMHEVCNAYKNQVRRTFTDAENDNMILNDLYERSNTDKQLFYLHKAAKMCGMLLVRPVYFADTDTIKLFSYTPDRFRGFYDENGNLERVIYPTTNGGESAYHEWTAEQIRVYNSKGKLIEVFDNQYLKLPFVIMKFDNTNNFYKSGEWSIVEAQLRANNFFFRADLNGAFNSSPIKIATNMGSSNIEFSPDKVIVINDIRQGEGMEIPPSLEYVSPDIQYENIKAYAMGIERDLKRAYGFTASMLDEQSGTITSGIARVIERQSLIERRQGELSYLVNFEKELVNMIIDVVNLDGAKTLTYIDNIQIDFEEERVYNEPEVEYNFDKIKTQDGVLSPKQFFTKWGGYDSQLSDEEFKQIILENKLLAKELGISATVEAPPVNNTQMLQETNHIENTDNVN